MRNEYWVYDRYTDLLGIEQYTRIAIFYDFDYAIAFSKSKNIKPKLGCFVVVDSLNFDTWLKELNRD